LAGVGDFIGPLVFLGIAAYGVYAYSKMLWPFDGSIMLPSLGGDGTMTPADGTGLGGDGTGAMDMTGVDPSGMPCTCPAGGMAGYVSYATKKKSSKSSVGSSGGGMMPVDMTMLPVDTTGGGMCDCSGGGGVDTTGGGLSPDTSGGGSSGGGGKKKKSSSKKKSSKHSSKKKSSSKHSSKKKKSHYAVYGDYGAIGEAISADFNYPDMWIANLAKTNDYGSIGNAISRDADVFRSYQGNYEKDDSYYPVQYGYLGTITNSRLNQLTGISSVQSNKNPLAEYSDSAIPVAIA